MGLLSRAFVLDILDCYRQVITTKAKEETQTDIRESLV